MQLDDRGLYDIYQMWHVPFWQTQWFFILWVATVTCAGGFIVYLLVRYWTNRYREKKLLYWQIALNNIYKLKDEGMLSVDAGPLFYQQLTLLLKEYMSIRYQHNYISKTDEEMVALLEDLHIKQEAVHDLHTIFTAGSYIKFANAVAAQQAIDRDFENAIAFIKLDSSNMQENSADVQT